MTVLVGKFGPLSLAESEAMRTLAKAFELSLAADSQSWAAAKLFVVYETECERLGLDPSLETFA